MCHVTNECPSDRHIEVTRLVTASDAGGTCRLPRFRLQMIPHTVSDIAYRYIDNNRRTVWATWLWLQEMCVNGRVHSPHWFRLHMLSTKFGPPDSAKCRIKMWCKIFMNLIDVCTKNLIDLQVQFIKHTWIHHLISSYWWATRITCILHQTK